MIAKLSYQKKVKLTGISFLLLLIICYRLAISNTLKERQLYKEQSEAMQQVQDPVNYLKQLQSRNNHINRLFDQFALDTLNPSKNLLAIVSNYCNDHKLQFKEYKPSGMVQKEELTILTRNIIVEGSFANCLGLVYELETQKKAGRVSSVLFKSYQDTKEKRTQLTCTIYVQNIITNPENPGK